MNIDLTLMTVEHDAWLKCNEALERSHGPHSSGHTWEELPELHAAIVVWGERLAMLRRVQTIEAVNSALADALRLQAIRPDRERGEK